MRVLVTGSDGFVGGWMVRELLQAGHQVVGAVRMGGGPPAVLSEAERLRVQWVDFDLLSSESINALARLGAEAVIHLAAVASGTDARQDPGHAWAVNAAGSARLAEALGRDPLLLLVSTGEVYGQGQGRPSVESDVVLPGSPYAASKLGAEIAVAEVSRRTGLRSVIVRAFPHTGPGQSDQYVVPALARRIRVAKRIGAPVIKTGNLDPVRDLLDVRDVVAAYRALLVAGQPGAIYNVASGHGVSLRQVVHRLMETVGHRVIVESDPQLARPNDLAYLVGDPGRLVRDTGWKPSISLEQTLKDLLDAQAD